MSWLRKAMGLLLVLALAATPVSGVPQSTSGSSGKVEAALRDRLEAGEQVDWIVQFADHADLSAAYALDWHERGLLVYSALAAAARRSQAQARSYLDHRGLPYQSYIAGNEMAVFSGDLEAVDALAALPEVSSIHAARTFSLDPLLPAAPARSSGPAVVDWGIADTGAERFWSAFGEAGEGVIVASIDSGVQWDHPALVDQFHCPGDPTNPACWSDPAGVCGPTGACDNAGHGTHTMGTMVAKDDLAQPYIAGMAPRADWITCKGCEDASGCSEASLDACADWILAPGGNPDNRPNVVNNSWGGSRCDDWFLAKVQAWQAAGIFPAFASGNWYFCDNISSPSDYQESFASVAHDSDRVLGEFSNKGPSCYGHEPYTKPNISAPGVDICSTWLDNGWECYTGTSMASPHSAGAVALLWSCNPDLIGQLDRTFQLLQDNAAPPPPGECGAPPDGEGNYSYGYGFLDVMAAGLRGCGHLGALGGHVADASTGAPIPGAQVSAWTDTLPPVSTQADAAGSYTLTLLAGSYTVTASAYGYQPEITGTIAVPSDTVTTLDWDLSPASLYHVGGYVTDAQSGWPLYARLDIQGYPYGPAWTDPVSGRYSLTLAAEIPYTWTVSAWTGGYDAEEWAVGPLTGSLTATFSLNVQTETCSAPGYRFERMAYYEPFEATDGGFVISGVNPSWERGRPTTGPGAAHSGSNVWATNLDGDYNDDEESYLISPIIDLSAYAGQELHLSWWQWLVSEEFSDLAFIFGSSDGGTSWEYLYGPAAGVIDESWTRHTLALDPSYAVSTFRFRFAMWTDNYIAEEGWYVDDVGIVVGGTEPGACLLSPGGLVVGNSYDEESRAALAGALVRNDSGGGFVTRATEDLGLDDAFYVLYSPAGTHPFTATAENHCPAIVSVNVVESDTVGQDLFLPAHSLVGAPDALAVTLPVDAYTSTRLLLENRGPDTVTFQLIEASLPRGEGDVPWLSEEPISGTIPAGGMQTVTVSFDAGPAGVPGPGSYTATLQVANDTACGPFDVPVTMAVVPPDTWGTLAGTVTTLGYCDAISYPLSGADVRVESGAGVSWTVTTDPVGAFAAGIDASYSPLTVSVIAADYLPAVVGGVVITPSMTTTLDLALRWLHACIRVVPPSLGITLTSGLSASLPLTITNGGALSTPFLLTERPELPWLGEDPSTGSVPADGAAAVGLFFTALPTMTAGSYGGLLELQTSDPENGIITIPVALSVVTGCVPVQDVALTWTPPAPIPGVVITFTAISTGSLPITYSWDMGEGENGSGSVITHTYATAGVYTVTLRAENACGVGEAEGVVEVVEVWRIYLPIVQVGR